MKVGPEDVAVRRGRSHPPSLLRLAERLIRDEGLLARGDLVLCACSGGPDSTALLHVLALLRARIGHQVAAHGVDHGLRIEAQAELARVQDLAVRLGLPFSTTRVDVAPGPNLQARAREARFAALAAQAAALGARAIATGHTADDRAETFLLRLLRGAGPRGLAVLPPRAPFPNGRWMLGGSAGASPDAPPNPSTLKGSAGASPAAPPQSPPAPPELIRPLLWARRSDVMAHLRRHHLAFAEDPSNTDTRFTRVRVRRELLPLLEELSPGIVDHLCALAEMLAAQRDLAGGAPGPGAQPACPAERWTSGMLAEVAGPEVAVPLGRAQRLAIERAKKLGRGLRVRVKGGEIALGFPEDDLVLIKDQPAHRRT